MAEELPSTRTLTIVQLKGCACVWCHGRMLHGSRRVGAVPDFLDRPIELWACDPPCSASPGGAS